MYTENFSEAQAVLSKTSGVAVSSEQNTLWLDMSKYHRVAIVLHAIASGTTIDIDVEVATDDAAAGLHTLKSMSQLDDSDGVIVCIEVRGEELGKPTGAPSENYRYLRVELTPSGNATYSLVVYGLEPRFAPAPATTWDQIVQ